MLIYRGKIQDVNIFFFYQWRFGEGKEREVGVSIGNRKRMGWAGLRHLRELRCGSTTSSYAKRA